MGNLKKPIEYKFDLNTKSQPKVLCVTHTDDYKSEVLKVGVYQGNLKYDLLQTVITARMVMRWTHELLADNVACTLSESCDILIPIDSSAIPVRAGEMLVEVNIKSTVNDETLTLQFPLIIRVNGSILNNAEVTPDSRGTIPELLQEVEQELERVQGFATEAQVFEILDNALSGSRNISPTLLVDNVTDQTHNPNGDLIMYYIDSDDVRHNIFNFSPYLGTKDYNALQNRPVVTGSNVSTSVSRELEGFLNFESNSFLVSAYQAPDQLDIGLSPSVPICKTTSNDRAGRYDFNKISGVFTNSGTFRVSANKTLNKPSALNDIVQELYITHIATIADEADLIRYVTGKTANGTIVNYIQTAILSKLGAYRFDVIYQSEWQKIGAKVSSAVVNQNGTITFTLDDGSTFTTTGSSVIGNDGFSPTVSTTSEYLRTRVEITDVNGTHNFFVNDGESVKSAIIDANGDLIITIKGKPTSGVHPTYPERIYNVGHVVGADGYSPTATVTQTSSGATISITDATGTTTANISNGSDYILTAQDKADIADLVLAELPTTQGVQYGNTGN